MLRQIVKVNHTSASIKSPHTKTMYEYHMKHFLDTKPPLDDEGLTEHIEGFLVGMQQSGLSSSSCEQAYYAIKHYYTHKPNKTLLEWEEIKEVLGAKNHTGHKKGLPHDKIKKLVDVSDVTDKAKIGCLISGMRREAMCDTKLEDMTFLPEHGIYEFRIYRNTDSEQIAFTTPEGTKWIQAYLDKIKPQYWLFPSRQIKDKPHLKGKQINPKSVTVQFIRLEILAGLRTRKTDGTLTEKAQHREDESAVHTFRHFARNAYKKARIPEENRKLLMGHSIGKVQAAYDETLSDQELHNQLLQDFLDSVKYLSIDQTLVLQTENTELKKAKSEIESLREQVMQLSKALYEAGILKKD